MTSSAAKGRARKERRTQEERRAETSARLLNASIELLLERGYSRFRIADAAALAGVSRGGQMYHFATKNDLINAAIEKVFESEANLARGRPSKATQAGILRESAAHIEDFLNSKLYQVSLNMLISAGASEHIADENRAISARNRAKIESAWIDRLVDAGTDRKKAEDVLWVMWSVQRALALQRRIGGDPGEDGDVLGFTIGLLNEYIRDEAGASTAA